MWDWIVENLVVLSCIAGAAVVVLLVVVFAKAAKKRKAKREERAIMSAEIPITDAEDEGEVSVAVKAREKGTSEFSWLKPLPEETKERKEEEEKKEPSSGTKAEKEKKNVTKTGSEAKESKTEKKNAKSSAENAKEKKAKQTAAKKDSVTAKAAQKTAPAPVSAAKEQKKAVGKWIVKEKGEGEFVAFLYANNGEVILTSEIYSSADGAKKGIQTIQKNVAGENFVVYCDKNRHYYFKLKTSGNRFLCVGETYPTENSCLSAVESVKRFADAPVQEEVVRELTFLKYVPSADDGKVRAGYAGKWTIERVDQTFMAKLYASNGELLLCSESYSQESSARAAVTAIRVNGLAGNFIIDRDKKGRYFFKLRNAQKTTLCVGETYSQLTACQSAIDSVRRFLKTAKLPGDDGAKG